MAVAAALVIVPGWGAVAAFGLLVLFTALLVSLIRSGQPIACSCFGAVSDEPVSWVEVARNVVLLAATATVVPLERLELPSFADIVSFSALAVIAAVAVLFFIFR